MQPCHGLWYSPEKFRAQGTFLVRDNRVRGLWVKVFHLPHGQFLQNCLFFYGLEIYWQDYIKQNYCLTLMDIMCWIAYFIIKLNLLGMGAGSIFPMTTNVHALMSCLHILDYPTNHGALWKMNTNIIETSASQCFQVLGGDYYLFCAFFCAGSLHSRRRVGSYCSENRRTRGLTSF